MSSVTVPPFVEAERIPTGEHGSYGRIFLLQGFSDLVVKTQPERFLLSCERELYRETSKLELDTPGLASLVLPLYVGEPYFDTGHEKKGVLLDMYFPYIKGGNLHSYHPGPLDQRTYLATNYSLNNLCSLISSLCEGLTLMHSLGRGFLHRDIREDNILYEKDYPSHEAKFYLADFGICRRYPPLFKGRSLWAERNDLVKLISRTTRENNLGVYGKDVLKIAAEFQAACSSYTFNAFSTHMVNALHEHFDR
jgi:serine/threonine protein kinase